MPPLAARNDNKTVAYPFFPQLVQIVDKIPVEI